MDLPDDLGPHINLMEGNAARPVPDTGPKSAAFHSGGDMIGCNTFRVLALVESNYTMNK